MAVAQMEQVWLAMMDPADYHGPTDSNWPTNLVSTGGRDEHLIGLLLIFSFGRWSAKLK